MSDIEIYSVAWLEQCISDINEFNNLSIIKEIFDNGGYVAGGSLRRAIERGNILSLFDKTKQWVKYNGVRYYKDYDFKTRSYDEKTKKTECNKTFTEVDIDVYFYNLSDFEKYFSLKKNVINDYINLTCIYKQYKEKGHINGGDCYFKSPMFYFEDEKYRIPINLIYVSCGEPENVIDDFDFVNCQVALTKKDFFIHKDMRELERQNILKVNKIMKNTLFDIRLKKYFCSKRYKKLENKRDLLMTIEKEINFNFSGGGYVFKNPLIFEDSDILFLFRKNMSRLVYFLKQRKTFNTENYKIVQEEQIVDK